MCSLWWFKIYCLLFPTEILKWWISKIIWRNTSWSHLLIFDLFWSHMLLRPNSSLTKMLTWVPSNNTCVYLCGHTVGSTSDNGLSLREDCVWCCNVVRFCSEIWHYTLQYSKIPGFLWKLLFNFWFTWLVFVARIKSLQDASTSYWTSDSHNCEKMVSGCSSKVKHKKNK